MPDEKKELSQAEKDDLQKRQKDFNAELMALLGKYNLGLGAQPLIIDGLIVAKPVIFDDSKPKDEKVEDKKSEIIPA